MRFYCGFHTVEVQLNAYQDPISKYDFRGGGNVKY